MEEVKELVGWFSLVMIGTLVDVSEVVVLENVDISLCVEGKLFVGSVMLPVV